MQAGRLHADGKVMRVSTLVLRIRPFLVMRVSTLVLRIRPFLVIRVSTLVLRIRPFLVLGSSGSCSSYSYSRTATNLCILTQMVMKN